MADDKLNNNILQFTGESAFSSFRLARILANNFHQVSLETNLVYWINCSTEFTADEITKIEQIISAKFIPHQLIIENTHWIIPRISTVSPWSSKANEILKICGFVDKFHRIEMGIAVNFTWLKDNLNQTIKQSIIKEVLANLHDRMTEQVIDNIADIRQLFSNCPDKSFTTIPLLTQGKSALNIANKNMGLSLSNDEINYLQVVFNKYQRDPTDVELMMFAQANSEHCRHKIFNASWEIDGVKQAQSLFAQIRATHNKSPTGTIVAYSDNAAVIEGGEGFLLAPQSQNQYCYQSKQINYLIKVETHNHPTAISPFPGAATGAGGEIRDEGATGRGAKPKAGLCGFSVSNLFIPEWQQPWESNNLRSSRQASALSIMLEGPIGAAAFNNEFGRPNLAGYFRSYQLQIDNHNYGYHKPIMLAGGLGSITSENNIKIDKFPKNTCFVQIGGQGMLIGLGGGAASSMNAGINNAELDFASVQRSNPEMQRRAQEVIDRCWQLGENNPILSIHDVGAGGLSNALPELAHSGQCGATFALRDIPLLSTGLAPHEIWCNEAQERYVLAIAEEKIKLFQQICQRERCPYALVGRANDDGNLLLSDELFENKPVDMQLDDLLGKTPQMLRQTSLINKPLSDLDLSKIELNEAINRVIQLPGVASKQFLITIGDRTVGGLTARDQMVGRWQVPVADVAVTMRDFISSEGEAMAIGERAPIAIIDPEAVARITVAEAITNILASDVQTLADIKLSANWMAACNHPGEDAKLYLAVNAISDFCQKLGVSIPVGKDSLSMLTTWQDESSQQIQQIYSPLSLVVSAFSRVKDVAKTLTPCLQTELNDSELLLIEVGKTWHVGASSLAQVYQVSGVDCVDVSAEQLANFFQAVLELKNYQNSNKTGLIYAYHDRSDGGLLATACEMAFASRCGITLDLDGICAALSNFDIDGSEKNRQQNLGRDHDLSFKALFNEGVGALIQIKKSERQIVGEILRKWQINYHFVGLINNSNQIKIVQNAKTIWRETRGKLQQKWSECSYKIQSLRDNPSCATSEFNQILNDNDSGLVVQPSFSIDEQILAPNLMLTRPKVAILREQGVNGHYEMAAAFSEAGFDCFDVHMQDILDEKVSLSEFVGLAACGGFSYGDVLGAGRGWAQAILNNHRCLEQFSNFFAREDSFSLGVCNGCQMMSSLREIIPGATNWSKFIRNTSEQYEARLVQVRIEESPSIFFSGMVGSILPIVVSHGEGRVDYLSNQNQTNIALRFSDSQGNSTNTYPFNPNGSPDGVTAFTSSDGRATIMMPHPERTFQVRQFSWYLDGFSVKSPWMRCFENLRKWVG